MSNSALQPAETPSNSYGDELPAGTSLCGGQYIIESYLNSGGFGITYLARDSLGRKIVIKECFPGAMCYRHHENVRPRSKGGETEFAKILELFEKEAWALSELQHPYIVGVHQIFNDNNTSYMALDFVPGRDLLEVIEGNADDLGPDEIKTLLLRLLEAISYVHERDILHRDISPDNILVEEDGSPVLIDFGAARESATRVSRVLSKVLTVKDGYSPQEFYLAGGEQRFASDLYALAATFYHLVSGKPPPSSQVRLAAIARKMEDPLEPLGSSIKGYDRHFLDAINQCLSIFPAERLQSANEWRDVIDTDRRRQVLLKQAQEDREMEKRISILVRESNRIDASDRKTKRLKKVEQPSPMPSSVQRTPSPAPQPKPQDASASVQVLAESPETLVSGPQVAAQVSDLECEITATRVTDAEVFIRTQTPRLSHFFSGSTRVIRGLQTLLMERGKEVHK